MPSDGLPNLRQTLIHLDSLAKRRSAQTVALVEANAARLRDAVTDWSQEDYGNGLQYLYVKRGEDATWELWKWAHWRTEGESGVDTLDRLREAGIDHLSIYKAITAFARCIKRADSFHALR